MVEVDRLSRDIKFVREGKQRLLELFEYNQGAVGYRMHEAIQHALSRYCRIQNISNEKHNDYAESDILHIMTNIKLRLNKKWLDLLSVPIFKEFLGPTLPSFKDNVIIAGDYPTGESRDKIFVEYMYLNKYNTMCLSITEITLNDSKLVIGKVYDGVYLNIPADSRIKARFDKKQEISVDETSLKKTNSKLVKYGEVLRKMKLEVLKNITDGDHKDDLRDAFNHIIDEIEQY